MDRIEELCQTMLKEHDEAINGNILPRLKQVEAVQESFNNQITQLQTNLAKVQTGQANLELTVMKDGQATRDLLNKFVDHFFKQDEIEAGSNERITIARLTTKEKLIVGVVGTVGGGGGLIAGVLALIQHFK